MKRFFLLLLSVILCLTLLGCTPRMASRTFFAMDTVMTVSAAGSEELLDGLQAMVQRLEKLLSVKPGMIGWWAANGRSNCTYESGERQKAELYYVDHCSIGLDIKIIFKTIIKVLKRDGAK